jgi:hypothetical protein
VRRNYWEREDKQNQRANHVCRSIWILRIREEITTAMKRKMERMTEMRTPSTRMLEPRLSNRSALRARGRIQITRATSRQGSICVLQVQEGIRLIKKTHRTTMSWRA